jgi:hypothetical protein
MSRSTTEQIVLDTIYDTAGVARPASRSESQFSGYPLAKQPAYAAFIFYLLWPVVVLAVWWLNRG